MRINYGYWVADKTEMAVGKKPTAIIFCKKRFN